MNFGGSCNYFDCENLKGGNDVKLFKFLLSGLRILY